MPDRGFSPDYSESTEIGRIMVSGAITEPKQLITKEYMEANAVAGPKGDPGIPGIPGIPGTDGADGADGGSAVIQGSATAAVILTKPHVAGHMWIATTTGTDSDGHPIAVGDGVVSDGAKWLTVGPIQGQKGDAGIPGADGLDAPSSHPLLSDRGAADAHPYTAITDVARVFTDRLAGYLPSGLLMPSMAAGSIDLIRKTSAYLTTTLSTGTFPLTVGTVPHGVIVTHMVDATLGIQIFYGRAVNAGIVAVRDITGATTVGPWSSDALSIAYAGDLDLILPNGPRYVTHRFSTNAPPGLPLYSLGIVETVYGPTMEDRKQTYTMIDASSNPRVFARTRRSNIWSAWKELGSEFTHVQLTQAAYTALATKDPKTIYLIVG